jgi:molecular chaperone GrpE
MADNLLNHKINQRSCQYFTSKKISTMTEEKKENTTEEQTKAEETVENMNEKNGKSSANDKKAKRAFVKKKSKTKELEGEINELKIKLAEQNDKYLRLFSEFDNYRKRTSKERLELSDLVAGNVITDLLPVVDDFDRAFKAMETKSDEEKSMLEGFTLIYNKFKNILNKRGLEPMKAVGENFDTDFHEALTNIPAPEEKLKGKVVDEIEKGYLFKGKVIRFAKVVVGQ